jgi:hypothetical protein
LVAFSKSTEMPRVNVVTLLVNVSRSKKGWTPGLYEQSPSIQHLSAHSLMSFPLT